MGRPYMDRDSFAYFCHRQEIRLNYHLGQSLGRIMAARKQAEKDANLEWETRGRIAGLSGMVHRPKD